MPPTQVSVNYLRYASKGCFASPLPHVVNALQCGRRIEPAVEALLAMGHLWCRHASGVLAGATNNVRTFMKTLVVALGVTLYYSAEKR
jgi:hypothetical protein